MKPSRIALAVVLLFAGSHPLLASESRNRSVVIVIIDSLRADHLQTYGYTRRDSPNILAFSRKATVFLNAYPAASWTRPSIPALLTGEYASELNSNPWGNAPLAKGHRTIATLLRSYGYKTGAFFNTAQMTPELSNLQDGFDEYVDYGRTGGKDTVNAYVSVGVDATIAFLDKTDQPALAVLHILDPHHPYIPHKNAFGKTPPEKYRDSYSLATGVPPPERLHDTPCYLLKNPAIVPELLELYDSEILELDRELGRLFAFLDATPRYRDALVVVTSDHGEEFGEHGGLFHGARMYEESLRVPLIIRDPVRPYGAGRRVRAIVSLVDVMPTILLAAGLIPNDEGYSGQSLLPYFGRRGGPPRSIAFIEKPGCTEGATVAVRKAQWKMIFHLAGTRVELYDLDRDPLEKHDLSGSRAADAVRAKKEITALFREWYDRVNRPLSTRNGDSTEEISPEIRARLKALGYIQ